MFGLGVPEVLVLGVWLAMFVACALRESGDRRVAWMIAIVFVPFLGAVAYFLVRFVPQLAASRPSSGVRS